MQLPPYAHPVGMTVLAAPPPSTTLAQGGFGREAPVDVQHAQPEEQQAADTVAGKRLSAGDDEDFGLAPARLSDGVAASSQRTEPESLHIEAQQRKPLLSAAAEVGGPGLGAHVRREGLHCLCRRCGARPHNTLVPTVLPGTCTAPSVQWDTSLCMLRVDVAYLRCSSLCCPGPECARPRRTGGLAARAQPLLP
jgi:hypothetical protein